MQFHAGSSLRTDFGNWYVPTIDALHNLCRAAGFSQVDTIVGPPTAPTAAGPGGRGTRRRPAAAGAAHRRPAGATAGAGAFPAVGAQRQLPRRRPRLPLTRRSRARRPGHEARHAQEL